MASLQQFDVFFTGGLDSTYRLCQLAQNINAMIQPVYIVFPVSGHKHSRPELYKEIEAQDKVLQYLVNHPNTKAKILPIKRVDSTMLRFSDMDKWEVTLSKALLGWQYLYFSSFSHQCKGVELCQERFPKGYFDRNLFKFEKDSFGRIIVKADEDNPKWLQEYAIFIWSDMSFPIYGVTRQQMKKDLFNWGYNGVLPFVWFCYKSIDGKPCGVCDNCMTKIKDGFADLFDHDSMRRFYISNILCFQYGLTLKRLYNEFIYQGEDEFIDFLESMNLGNKMKPSDYYDVLGVRKLFSMHYKKLEVLFKKYVREVKR